MILRDLATNDRGVALIVVALGLAAFLGVAALALDMGMLYTTRTESQRVADGAALAGASQFIENPNDPNLDPLVRQEATAYAAMNNVHGDPVGLDPTADIQVWLADDSVKVTVRHTVPRGNPISTYFARILGFDVGEVITDATAWAAPMGAVSTTCSLPVAMGDRWWQHPDGTPAWEPELGDDYYTPEEGEPPHRPEDHTYNETTVGDSIMLKPSQGGTSPTSDDGAYFEPGWWYLWSNCPGVNSVSEMILECNAECGTVTEGDTLTDQNGNAQAVVKAFEDLIAQDPDAYWEPGCKDGLSCVKNSKCELETEDCDLSPRVRAVPLFDPRTYTLEGADENFEVSTLVHVFVEGVSVDAFGRRNVWIRIGSASGVGGVDPSKITKVTKILRLVE